MPNFTPTALIQVLVVLLTIVGSTVLAYVGKIDGTAAQTVYLAVAAYVFGYSHAAVSNGTPKQSG